MKQNDKLYMLYKNNLKQFDKLYGENLKLQRSQSQNGRRITDLESKLNAERKRRRDLVKMYIIVIMCELLLLN